MLRILFFLLGMVAANPLLAQQANFNYQGNQTTSTVATPANFGTIANAFVNILPLTPGRQSCWIQYRPVSATPGAATLGFVFFGSSAPTTTPAAFALVPFQILNCEQASEVEGDAVWISSTQTNDTFTIKVK